VTTARAAVGLVLAGAAMLVPSASVGAQGPTVSGDRSEAVVFVRALGRFRVQFDEPYKKAVEERDVEIATGTGFFVNSEGLLLTSHHVVAGGRQRRRIAGEEAEVERVVERIEAVVASAGGPQRLSASLLAVDADKDLALLTVTAGGLGYLPLGDSAAARAGEPTTVLGFPLGRAVEVGRTDAPEVVPQLTVSPGSLSARRDDEAGSARYLQTDATLNPGNSGGPLLDADGYVLGVVEMKLNGATGLGFAVPVNLVKDFLETTGFLPQLPSARLRPGPLQSLADKGLRLKLPEGFEDTAPDRLRVEAAPDGAGARLIVDRVASPWSLADLEQALTDGSGFEGPRPRAPGQRRGGASTNPRRVQGFARGAAADGSPLWMEYAVLDLGRENVVARYVGAPDAMAFNLSVLRESLDEIEADPLLAGEVGAPLDVPLASVTTRVPGVPEARLPSGFWAAAGGRGACNSLPEPDAGVVASPPGDFTVVFRWRYWLRAPGAAPVLAAACQPAWPSSGASFGGPSERFGITYRTEGLFRALGEGLLGLEVEAPVTKGTFLDGLVRRFLAEGTMPAR
jgi:S1-C subfamily serine protease